MNKIILYNYFRSSTSYRARIALHLKGIEFEYKAIHLLNNGGEQNSIEYRKINPGGGVPSLQHNDKIIGESRAIIEYLDDVFPDVPLLPNDPYLKAKTKQICDHVNTSMHPLGNLRVLKYLETQFGYDLAQKELWVAHWLTPALVALEALVAETAGKFSVGDQVTIADTFIIPQLFTCQRFKVDITPYPTLNRINNECLKLDAFKKAHPFRQIDTPEEFRI